MIHDHRTCPVSHSGYNGYIKKFIQAKPMKIMSARDAKNHFGEFLDAARREPVIVTKNNRPVGIMISIEDAADTLLPEFLLDKAPDYDGWLFEKVSKVLNRVDRGETRLHTHDEAMALMQKRLEDRTNRRTL